MKRATQSLLVIGALLATPAGQAAGDRLLFDNPGFSVTTNALATECGRPATVTIESNDPELFESEPELQRIVDGAQAVLAYECPRIRAIRVRGLLTGISDPVYKGVSRKPSGWLLDTRQSFETQESGHDWDDSDTENDEPDRNVSVDQFNVANLQAGMPIDDAMATVEETFGIEPAYDLQEGLLTMRANGCPEDYDWSTLSPIPRPGWKCLRAWFTDQRVARLYLLELIQVVDGNRAESVESFLINQFGEPEIERRHEAVERWEEDGDAGSMLAWGKTLRTEPVSENPNATKRHTLQAHIIPVEDVTILTVTLYEPDVRPGGSARTDPPPLDLNL